MYRSTIPKSKTLNEIWETIDKKRSVEQFEAVDQTLRGNCN